MPKQTTKQDALNYVKQMCFTVKANIASLGMKEINNIKIQKDLDEFILYFENALYSSDPFIENVAKMREQGIWLPDKITDASVKLGYYNVAKGYFYKVFENKSFTDILFRTNTPKSREMMNALQAVNKFLSEIINGEIEITQSDERGDAVES